MKPLPVEHVDMVCKDDKGAIQCKYLAKNTETPSICYCLKISPITKTILDQEAKRIENAKLPFDLTEATLPLGDNCPGGFARGYQCAK